MSAINTLAYITKHPLNRGRPINALTRFFKWQIGSRLVPGPVVYSWVNGAKIIVRPGEEGFTQNIYCGLHEFGDTAFLLHFIGSEDLFVDIGANVGAYTILACAVKGARGVCFEPIPETFGRLVDNLRINDLFERVKAFNIGLSDKEGELVFTSAQNVANHVLSENEIEPDVTRVKVACLDRMLDGQYPALIKIDVEGFETQVLAGAKGVLSRESLLAVIMELNGSGSRYGFKEEDLLKTMTDYGFATFLYEPFSRDLKQVAKGQWPEGNLIFARNEKVVRERIQKAPKIQIGSIQL